jgi:hypothetical protein
MFYYTPPWRALVIDQITYTRVFSIPSAHQGVLKLKSFHMKRAVKLKVICLFWIRSIYISHSLASIMNYLIVYCMRMVVQLNVMFFHEMKIYWYRTCTKFYPYKASQGLFVL